MHWRLQRSFPPFVAAAKAIFVALGRAFHLQIAVGRGRCVRRCVIVDA